MYRLFVIVSILVSQTSIFLLGQVEVEPDYNRVYVLGDSEARRISFNITYLDSASLVDADTFYLHLPSQFRWSVEFPIGENGFVIADSSSKILKFWAPENIDINMQYIFSTLTIKIDSLTEGFEYLRVSLPDSGFVYTSVNGLKVVEFDSIGISKRYYIGGDISSTDITITFNALAFYPNHTLFLQLPDGFEWDIAGFQPPSGVSKSLENNNHRLRLGIDSELGTTLNLSELKIIPMVSGSATGVIQVALLDVSEAYAQGQYSSDSIYFDTPQFTLAFEPVAMVGDPLLREFPNIIVDSYYPQVLNERVLTVTLPLGLTWGNGNQSILVTLSDTSNTVNNPNLVTFGSSEANKGIDNLEFRFNNNESIYQSDDEITVTSIKSDTIPNNNWIIGDGERDLGNIVITFSESPFKPGYFFHLHLSDGSDLSFTGSPNITPNIGTATFSIDSNTVWWQISDNLSDTSLAIQNLNIYINNNVNIGSYGIEFAILRSDNFSSQNQLSMETINIFEPTFNLSYTPVYITQDVNNRNFPIINMGNIGNGDVLSNRTLDLYLPLGINWVPGDSIHQVQAQDTIDNLKVDMVSSITGSKPLSVRFDGNDTPFPTETSIVVTAFNSVTIDTTAFISGDNRSVGDISISLQSPGLYNNHNLFLILPTGFKWDTSQFSPPDFFDTLDVIENNTVLNLPIKSTTQNTQVILSGLLVDAQGSGGNIGPLQVALLHEDETSISGQFISADSLYIGEPSFELVRPNDGYGLSPNNYRPIYIKGDPEDRLLLSFRIKDDTTYPVLANRKLRVRLPSQIKWKSWSTPQGTTINTETGDSTTLVITMVSDLSYSIIEVNELTIGNFSNTVDTTLSISIIGNHQRSWIIDDPKIQVVEPPVFTFSNGDSSQVFWTKTDGNSAQWKLKPIKSNSITDTVFFKERDIYFRVWNSDNIKVIENDGIANTFWYDLSSNKKNITIQDVIQLSVDGIALADTLEFTITGNPETMDNAYWITAESLIFRSVNPTIHVDPQAFLKGDTDESIQVEITTNYPIAFQESSPYVVLPDSFPGDFSRGGKDSLILWNEADNIEKSLPLGEIDGVMNWAPMTLRHSHPEWAIDASAAYRFSDNKSVKVGTYYAPILGDDIMVFTYNDPDYVLDTIKILLGYDAPDTWLGVQPLIKGDNVYIYFDTIGVHFGGSVVAALNGNTDTSGKLGQPTIVDNDSLTLSIPILKNLDNTDRFLTLTGLSLREFTDTTHHLYPLKVSLRPPDETNHKIETLANIGIGRPQVNAAVTIYIDPTDNSVYTMPTLEITEDANFRTLEATSDDFTSILCFELSDTSKVRWDTSRNGFTAGYGNAWDNLKHYPELTSNKKCYTINTTFNTTNSAVFYLFDNLLLDSVNASDSINLLISNNNGETNFETTKIVFKAKPRFTFAPDDKQLTVLKSNKFFTIESLKIENIPDCADTVEIVIPLDLSFRWDPDGISGINNFSVLGQGDYSNKYLKKGIQVGDSIEIDSVRLVIDNRPSSAMGNLRVVFQKCSENLGEITSIVSDNTIILGSPTGEMEKHLILLAGYNNVTLDTLTVDQDLILLDNYGFRFIEQNDTVTISIPDSVDGIRFDTNQAITVQYFQQDGIIVEDTISLQNETSLKIIMSNEFRRVRISSIGLIVTDGSQTIRPFTLKLLWNGVEFGSTKKTIRLANPSIRFAEKHLSILPDQNLHLGSVTINPGSVTAFPMGARVAISAILENYEGGDKFIKWGKNPFAEGFSDTSVSRDKSKAYATVNSTISDSFPLLLKTEFDIDSLLLLSEFNVNSFKDGRGIKIQLDFISDNNLLFSSDTVAIISQNAYRFHLPPFLTYPSFSNTTLTFEIIDGLYELSENANWKDVFRILPANTSGEFFDSLTPNTLWPPFDSVDTGGSTHSTQFLTVRTVRKVQKRDDKQNRFTKNIKRSRKLLKKGSPVKSDIRKDSRRQKKLEKRKAKASLFNLKTVSSSGNNRRTVTAVFDSTTLIWFNELLFDHIQNSTNQKNLFYIGLTDSISTSDTKLKVHDSDFKREFGAIPVDFGIFDPLADSAIVEGLGRVFNDQYSLTLRNIDGVKMDDELVQIFSNVVDTQSVNTTLANLRDGTGNLGEGLYLVKVHNITGCFPIYRQIIKDTIKPIISGITPKQVRAHPEHPLTISYDADAMRFQFYDNFNMNNQFLFQYEQEILVTDTGDTLIMSSNRDTLELWAPFIPTLQNTYSVQIKYLDGDTTIQYLTPFALPISLEDSGAVSMEDSLNVTTLFSQFLTDSLEGKIALTLTAVDAAGNTSVSDMLFYNVMVSGGKESLISNHIFNYPNPFRVGPGFGEGTKFRYVLSEDIKSGQLAIFDAGGDLVYYWDLKLNNLNTPGTHFIDWDGKNLFGRRLSTGVYFGYFEVNYKGNRKGEKSFLKIAINNR